MCITEILSKLYLNIVIFNIIIKNVIIKNIYLLLNKYFIHKGMCIINLIDLLSPVDTDFVLK